MAHIETHNEQPGIRELFAFRPETAQPLQLLAQTLLRGASTLEPHERELIAAAVSRENDCTFCHASHAAAANALVDDASYTRNALAGERDVGKKLEALLPIARAVARGGKAVTTAMIDAARTAGATDVEVHDTVLIAAAFCMFNRYVDGLGARTPHDDDAYAQMGAVMAKQGYVR
jgi:uncharacterized peroxidase-related enzyme